MSLQGINPNSIPFKAAEGQQTSSSSGITFPVLGLAAGGATAAFTKFGKTAPKLESLTVDEFKKSMPTDLAGEEKTAAETVEKYLAKKPTETEAKPEVKADAKPEAKGKTTGTPVTEKTKSLATDKSVKEIFDDAKELSATEYLDNKYDASSTQDLIDSIKSERNEFNKAGYKKAIGNAKYGVDNAKAYSAYLATTTKLDNKIAQNKIDIEGLKQSIAGEDPSSAKVKNTNRKIEQLEKEITRIDEQKAKMKAPKTAGKGFTVDKKAITEETDKATKSGGRIDVAVNKAKADKLKEIQDKAVAERNKELKAAKKPPLTASEEKGLRALTKTEDSTKKALDQVEEFVTKKKTLEITNNATTKQVEAFNGKIVKEAQHNLAKQQKAQGRHTAKIAEMESDLELVRKAKKECKAITRETASDVISKSVTKIKDEVKKLGGEAADDAAKAYEKVKGHMPKKINWGKTAIGAGIGLVAGLIIKGMVDKKPEQVA